VTIDLAVLLLVLFVGFLGLWSGAIKQVAHLAGLIAGWLLSRPLGVLLAPYAAKKIAAPPLFVTIACSFVAFFVIYVVVVLVLRFVLTRVLPDGEHGWLNKVGGLGLGTAKAAVMAFVFLSALVFAERFVGTLVPGFQAEAKASLSMKFARHYNLFAGLPGVGGLEKILQASRDPSAAARLAEDPEFQALARDPRVRGMVDDAGIRRAMQEGDYAALLSSYKVMDALNDPGFVARLSKLESGARPAKPAEAPARPPARPPKDSR
jgi:membrane protein required for colicin V production